MKRTARPEFLGGAPATTTTVIPTEERFTQMQRLEALGALAAGVAHDFNNILCVILGCSETLAASLAPKDPMHEDLEEIQAAAARATALTQQLLAFSRQQVIEPQIIDVSSVISDVVKMLRRLVGADVELNVVSGAELGTVLADPGQIEQVLINLVVNARDAMPNGGALTIETSKVTFDDAYAVAHMGVKPGDYVMLAVTDTGTGMDAATRARIFDPFFTTKEKGKGMGLGLSTIFGIVQQSGGHISVQSKVGAGTVIRLYLPHVGGSAVAATDASGPTAARGGAETILLVEDDASVRAVTRSILERHGYRVLEAHSAGDALLICEQHEASIHLLLSDVVMPRMSGPKLAERLGPLRPEMKVLFMSGYAGCSVIRNGFPDQGAVFLQKPMTVETLTRKVREVLG